MIVAGSHTTNFAPGLVANTLAEFSGFVAVIGFLVLSGYSIAHSLQISPSKFYQRRAIRIMPLYVLSIGIAWVVGAAFELPQTYSPAPSALTAISNLAFLQIFTGNSVLTNAVVWTLAVEAVFYMAAPWLKTWRSYSVLIAAGLSAIAFIVNTKFGQLPPYSKMPWGANIVFFAWPWLLGFWFYCLRSVDLARWIVVCAPIAVCTAYKSQSFWPLTVLASMLTLAFAPNIILPRFVSKIFSRLGDISYPLYLFHLPILIVASYFGLANGLALLLLCTAAAWFLDVFYDKPTASIFRSILLMRKKFPAASAARP